MHSNTKLSIDGYLEREDLGATVGVGEAGFVKVPGCLVF